MAGRRPRSGRCAARRTVGRRRRARHRRRDPMTRVQTLPLALGIALAALAVGWLAGRATSDSPAAPTSAEAPAERKPRSDEHTHDLKSLMRPSYDVFRLRQQT